MGLGNIPGYRRPYPGTQPNHLHSPYVSSIKRAPTKPLIHLPNILSEVTGPSFGTETVSVKAFDLTKQHSGEPLGERIIVSGRVLDENGRPVRNTLIEIWQANAAGRYLPKRDQHEAPHILVIVFMRGLLRHLYTRIYFPHDSANASDFALNLVEPARRETLIAKKKGGLSGVSEWNVILQGPAETVFFDCGL